MPALLPDKLDVTLDFDAIQKAGSMAGSGGVVVLDDTLRVRTMNSAAAQILGVTTSMLDAQPLTALGQPGEALHAFGETVAARFGELEGEWQEQIDYTDHGSSQTLLLRGTRLPPGVDQVIV